MYSVSGKEAQPELVGFVDLFSLSELSSLSATRDKQNEFLEMVAKCSLGLLSGSWYLKCLDSTQKLQRIFSPCVPMEKSCRCLWFIIHPGTICLYQRSQMSFKYIYTYMHECLSAGCQEIVLIKRNHGEYEQMCSMERAQLKTRRCCLEKVCICQGWIISVVRQKVCRCAWKSYFFSELEECALN